MAESKLFDHSRMPFLESLVTEKNRHQVSFHMPGHKGTMALHPLLDDYIGHEIYKADLVEINGIIDYLHAPKGTLKEAQQMAADAYGADETFFLINGSTVGNEGAIMSVSGAGQKVIMTRASHRSVYGGVVLSGATPIYIEPEYHPQIGFPLAVRAEIVEQLFAEHDDIAAIHITSPNYYGVQSDTAKIAEIAHQHGAVLIVDEAHGSHLNFHEHLPQSATRLGADLIIQSTHKTQGALTQASMLHLNRSERVNVARVGQVLSLLQTSSPSSPLLATLDFARMQMATEGQARLSEVLSLCEMARNAIRQMAGLWCYGDDLVGEYGIHAVDPTKLIVRVMDAGYTGFEAYRILRDEYGIDGEFADLRQVIFSVTIGDKQETIDTLLQGLQALSDNRREALIVQDEVAPPAQLPRLHITPQEAYFAPSRLVSASEAVGQIVAENIIPYPPGIPLLVPGEQLEQHHLDYLAYIVSKGGNVVGMEDASLQQIRIVVDG
ncbi:MAG: aminotransferase class V-fold PLP-dependent enzyme [Chloroflexota bacterium]